VSAKKATIKIGDRQFQATPMQTDEMIRYLDQVEELESQRTKKGLSTYLKCTREIIFASIKRADPEITLETVGSLDASETIEAMEAIIRVSTPGEIPSIPKWTVN